jgi:predicted FMN-binding regulatory protein PaiB
MRANSFVTLVSILNGIPFASHIPLVIEFEYNLGIKHVPTKHVFENLSKETLETLNKITRQLLS